MLFRIFLIVIATNPAFGQSYSDSLSTHRQEFLLNLTKGDRAPIKDSADLKYVTFFDPDQNYRVTATFKKTKDAKPFEMPTLNGKSKAYVEYGKLFFLLNGKKHSLSIYQNINLITKPEYKDHLFLPFTDSTNGNETYISGRYLDFEKGDIINNRLTIDFNKAYNPYCAYSDGYSCPKPPHENRLKTSIRAGEKSFSRDHE